MDKQESIMGLEVGSRIHDRYEIRDLVGRGGFAAVFRAHDLEIERDVAIKVLHIASLVSQGNDRDLMLARFKREAKLAAQINHRCVVQIYDYGVLEEEQNPFIIMEMLDGHDLDDELEQRGGLAPERIIPLFVDCLEALGDAHQLGIVHKDLKPSNLFLTDPRTRRETMKLVDFGIAHPGDSNRERLTRTGFMLGTFEYMAPEYIEDQIISPGIDVYQMGLILVEALAGRVVVEATNPWKCSMKHVGREIEIPKRLLESPLAPIIDKATALDPDDRYQSAAEFAQELLDVDIEAVPHLEGAVQWQPLGDSDIEVSTPDESTRAIIEDVESARAHVSDSELEGEAEKAGFDSATLPDTGGTTADKTSGETSSLKRYRLALIAIFIASVVAVIGTSFAVFTTASNTDGGEAVAGVEAETEGDEAQGGAVGEDEPLDEEIDEEEADEPQPVEVTIETRPAEATLAADGEIFDDDRAVFGFRSSDSEPVQFVIDHDGYRSKTIDVGPDDGPVVEVELEPDDESDQSGSALGTGRPDGESGAAAATDDSSGQPEDTDSNDLSEPEESDAEQQPAADAVEEEGEDSDGDDSSDGWLMAP